MIQILRTRHCTDECKDAGSLGAHENCARLSNSDSTASICLGEAVLVLGVSEPLVQQVFARPWLHLLRRAGFTHFWRPSQVFFRTKKIHLMGRGIGDLSFGGADKQFCKNPSLFSCKLPSVQLNKVCRIVAGHVASPVRQLCSSEQHTLSKLELQFGCNHPARCILTRKVKWPR